MSKSSKGLVVVIAAGVAGAAALAAIYLTVLAPRAAERDAHAEIEAWGAKWRAARTCVVGARPRSADPVEAVILREMVSHGNVVEELRRCRPLLRGLRRDDGPGQVSAGPVLEERWSAVGAALTAAMEAFAWRVSPRPNREPPALRQALGKGLARLDEAYAALRAEAGLPAQPPPGARLVSLPAGRAITDPAGKPLLPSEIRVTGNQIAARAERDGQAWLIRQVDESGARIAPVGPAVVPALDGSGWGAWQEDGELRAGSLDPVGDPAGDGALVAPAGRERELIAALSDGAVRAVVYRDPERTWMARSRDAGASWPEQIPVTPGEGEQVGAHVLPEAERIDLVWTRREGGLAWLSLAAGSLEGAPAPRLLLAEGTIIPSGAPCAAAGLTWWQIDGGTFLAGETAAQPIAGAADLLVPWHCDGDRLLARARAGRDAGRVVVCSSTGCQHSAGVPGLDGDEAALALGRSRGPLVAVAADGLLVLWSGDPDREQPFHPAAAARLPAGHHLVGLVEWNGRLSIVTRTDEAVHVVPLDAAAPAVGASAG